VKVELFNERLKRELGDAPLRPLDPNQLCPCGCGQTIREISENAPDLDERSGVHRRP
jgi:hypothetical protein